MSKFAAAAAASDKELDSMRRRVASLANHLVPVPPTSTHASFGLFQNATSMNDDSYHRKHGEVPTHDAVWKIASDDSGKEFTDIVYEKSVGEGIAKITINRPERRNAFRPHTIKELIRAFEDARDDASVGRDGATLS